jgi:hypothetical protein
MARDHAAIRLNIWGDDDWRELSIAAQHLYLHLLSTPTLSYAGVADWRAARIAGVSKDATARSVTAAADELVDALFVVYDDDTEEILIRSFLKYDGLLHKPNVAKAMVTAYGKTVSPILRGVTVHELTKLHDRNPEWKGFTVREVTDLLSRPSVNPEELLGKGSIKGSAKGSNLDPSLLTPNSLLLTPDTTHLATSTNAVRNDVMGLCQLLQSLIEGNGSKRPEITDGWLTDARLLIDKDKREPEAAARLMRWCQNDSFWRSNILSMPKFRKRYDQLRLAANDEQSKKSGRVKQTPTERAQQTLTLATEIDMKGIGN